MDRLLRLWPWIWLAFALAAFFADSVPWPMALIGGIALGAVFSMVGLYFNSHLRAGRGRIAIGGTLLGLVGALATVPRFAPLPWTLRATLTIVALLGGCLVESLVRLLSARKSLPPAPRPAADQAAWRSLNLNTITSEGARVLAVRGSAKSLRQIEHGGSSEQYLEFDPKGSYLVSWTPGRIELFSVENGDSLGCLQGEYGLVGFDAAGTVLFAVLGGEVASYSLPKLTLTGWRPLSHQSPDWSAREGSWVYSRRSGFVVSVQAPAITLNYPYHRRVSDSHQLLASPGAYNVMMSSLCEERKFWLSDDVGRDVTSVGFSADGNLLAFGTMGGSLFLADAATLEIRRQLLVDGEIRCLAVSADGRVAVGCADLSSKVWVFALEDGAHAHLIEASSDTWAVAFSSDGKLLATGHENGKVALWRRDQLPCPQWLPLKI